MIFSKLLGKVFQQCYVFKTFHSTLKYEGKGRNKGKEKRGERKKKGEKRRKKTCGEGKRIFSKVQCYVLKTFPSPLENEGKGRKR